MFQLAMPGAQTACWLGSRGMRGTRSVMALAITALSAGVLVTAVNRGQTASWFELTAS